jgi:V8-like Glu-specific endopeptidase
MSNLSIFEKIALATIRIECVLSDGAISTGTGFFMKFYEHDNGNFVPAIVTNKHVIEGSVRGKIFFTLSERMKSYPAYGFTYKYEITEFENAWRMHPNDDIDLCAMPIEIFVSDMQRQGIIPFIQFLDLSLLPSDDDIESMIGSEKVTMIGYPNGLWDSKNNQPIFRSGIVASHYKFDWNEKSEFVIDAACVPGSSGSPVLLIDIGQVNSKKGLNIGSSRIKFLGILYAGPMMAADGTIEIQTIPTTNQIKTRTKIPINLGYVIKSSNLLIFNEIFKNELKSNS